MKSTEAGRVIGIALESFNNTKTQCETESVKNEETGETEEIETCQPIENETGKILVFINPHWSLGSLAEDGSLTTTEGEAISTEDEQPTILDQFTLTIKNSLKKLGLFIENGIVGVKKLIAEVAQLDKLEMRDQATGEIYCTWIENGEWVKAKGECEIAPAPEPSCDANNLNLCLTQTDCESNSGYWYNETCNAEPETLACTPADEICDGIDNNCDGQIDEGGVCETASPPAEDVCDATHLNLCTSQAECETAAGFWYNESCNAEPEAPACVPDWSYTGWEPLPETVACGGNFTQTRTCTDSNNCGTDEEKPIESQDATGNLCSAQNATGACQEGSCNFTCADGFSDCDSDMSNGCEIIGECQPLEQ